MALLRHGPSLTLSPVWHETECKMTTLSISPAMEFSCSFCDERKGDAENWLLGFEGTKEKSVAMKCTINLHEKWDEQRTNMPTEVMEKVHGQLHDEVIEELKNASIEIPPNKRN